VERQRGLIVQAADHLHRFQPVLDEVVRAWFDDQLHSFPLEDRQQLIHRFQKVSLRRLR
jgi:hypothetical protein